MIVYNAEPLNYSSKAISIWNKKGYVYLPGSWEEIDSISTFNEVDILIVRLARKVNKQVLDKFPNLKILISATTGLDHIEINELTKRKITLLSLKEHREFLETIPSTAEHTWALILALLRKIPFADKHVSDGYWQRDLFRGHQIKGKTIGIIGLGRIGKKVALIAEAFENKIYYYDPFVINNRYKKAIEINELLSTSDIITIHVPLNESTKLLINKNNINYIKNGSFLINTSRGEVLDEISVVEAIKSGKLAGLAVDVLVNEQEDIRNNLLWQLKKNFQNIIITPHIGGATFEAMEQCEEYLAGLI